MADLMHQTDFAASPQQVYARRRGCAPASVARRCTRPTVLPHADYNEATAAAAAAAASWFQIQARSSAWVSSCRSRAARSPLAAS